MKPYTIKIGEEYSSGLFSSMACPCEILVKSCDRKTIEALTQAAYNEAIRIEKKFSRYRTDNIIHQINTSQGQAVTVDHETALLLDFADECYNLSEGKFDITSGALRKLWPFDNKSTVPSQGEISALLNHIGWHKVNWNLPEITLQPGMQIDLGGIGKEYAVDTCLKILRQKTDCSVLVNFGGDICCSGPEQETTESKKNEWLIGIEAPDNTQQPVRKISLYRGGLATSGDTKRFIIHNGKRYGHILNPLTGYPVSNAPRSVTVAANSCIEAGMLATFAMLEEEKASAFLDEQGVDYWCIV